MNSKHVRSDGFPPNRKVPQEEKRNRNRCASINLPRNEIELKRFEDKRQVVHPEEYPRCGSEAGLLVTFNQITYTDDIRFGTNRDVNELILTFGRLGYNIDQEFIYTDLTKKEILDTIDSLSKRDFSSRNCLIVVVLTHGSKNDVIHTLNGDISAREIWQPFYNSRCSSFKNKPKFFIFQACKGSNFSHIDQDNVEVIPESTFSEFLEADMLIAYATVEGSKSIRNINTGTWFIQELCRNFNANGRREDVLSLLMRITKCIANNYYYVDDDNRLIKQIPLFVSTLTKKFYLTFSKQRQLFLQMIERQEEVIKNVKDIHTLAHNKKK